MADQLELPSRPGTETLARRSDPETSVEAACKAARASKKAMAAVRKVMSDGVPRIDEEIWAACRAAGYISSFDAVRHGRRALSEARVILDTGERRNTESGAASRVWRIA